MNNDENVREDGERLEHTAPTGSDAPRGGEGPTRAGAPASAEGLAQAGAGAGAPTGAEGLAQAIFSADEMKRQAALDHEREEKAAAGLRLASKVLCSRAIDDLEECESWPAPPDFDKLMRLLDKSMEVARVREGIERELAWCEKFLDAGADNCEEPSDEAMRICTAYRQQMVEYATKMLAPGETLDEGVVAKPCFQLEPLSNASVDVLRELLGEVRTAYAKFCRVLSDNGPFSLHPTSYLDEDVKLAEEIEYLRETNAKPYYGPLDDDPMDHVDAFWEGFIKLGGTCKGKATMNLTPVLSYFSTMADELSRELMGKKLKGTDDISLLNAIPRDEE